MELSYQLQTLEPLTGALDIIRYFGAHEGLTADADEIQESVGLSDRSFGKAIKRLVTKGYIQMDGNRIYRLTEQGQRAVEELREYDAATPAGERSASSTAESEQLMRRLVMALPRRVTAGQPTHVLVGVNPATYGETLDQPVDMLLRLSVINGDLNTSADVSLELANDAVQSAYQVTPGAYTQMRLRLEAFQMDPYSGDITSTGGMYVDVDVTAEDSPAELTAYGTDISITPVA